MTTDIAESPLVGLLQKEGAELILQYGSSVRQEEYQNDIDLCVIGDFDNRTHFQLADFDVIRLTWTEFEYYRRRLDPVYCTEPLLTGSIVFDPTDQASSLQTEIRNREPDQEVISHNVEQSFYHLQRAKQDSTEYPIEALRFATSYWLFGSWYFHGRSPARLDQVIDLSSAPSELAALIDVTHVGNNQPDCRITVERAYELTFEVMLQEKLFT